MLSNAFDALVVGMGLKPPHIRFLTRVTWVVLVSGHIAWVCGYLITFGFAAPFARASDVEELKNAAKVSARINMQTEIRVQTRLWCTNTDPEIRASAYQNIQRLRIDLEKIADVKEPEPRCQP